MVKAFEPYDELVKLDEDWMKSPEGKTRWRNLFERWVLDFLLSSFCVLGCEIVLFLYAYVILIDGTTLRLQRSFPLLNLACTNNSKLYQVGDQVPDSAHPWMTYRIYLRFIYTTK